MTSLLSGVMPIVRPLGRFTRRSPRSSRPDRSIILSPGPPQGEAPVVIGQYNQRGAGLDAHVARARMDRPTRVHTARTLDGQSLCRLNPGGRLSVPGEVEVNASTLRRSRAQSLSRKRSKGRTCPPRRDGKDCVTGSYPAQRSTSGSLSSAICRFTPRTRAVPQGGLSWGSRGSTQDCVPRSQISPARLNTSRTSGAMASKVSWLASAPRSETK